MTATVDPRRAFSRRFLDDGLIQWEAYVSGGQPQTARAARIFFVCMENRLEVPRWVEHSSRSVAEATRELGAMEDAELVDLLQEATPVD